MHLYSVALQSGGFDQNPNTKARVFILRAAANFALGLDQHTIDDVTSALALEHELRDEELASAFDLRSRARTARKDFKGALNDLDQIDNLMPGLTDTHLRRGLILYTQKAYSLAIPEFIKVIQNDPENLSANDGLALSYLAKNELLKALQQLNKVIMLRPNQPDGYLGRMLTLIKLGQEKAAKVDYDRAVALGYDPEKKN